MPIRRPMASRDALMTCQECNAVMQRIFSSFSIGRNYNSSILSENQNEPTCTQSANKAGGTAIKLGGGIHSVKHCSFNNVGTGISLAEGSRLDMSDNEFINVPNPIEVAN